MKQLICSMLYTIGKWVLILFVFIIIILGISREQLSVQQSALEGRIDKLNVEIYELRMQIEAIKYRNILNAEEQIMEDVK